MTTRVVVAAAAVFIALPPTIDEEWKIRAVPVLVQNHTSR
jgi:hypothetical protein